MSRRLTTRIDGIKISLKKNSNVVFFALKCMSKQQRRNYVLLVIANSSLAIMDLIGVACFALLATIAIRGFQSITPGPTILKILEFFNLEGIQFRNLLLLFAVIGSAFLVTKSVLSIKMSLRTQQYLGKLSAGISSTYLSNVLAGKLESLERSSRQVIRFNVFFGSQAIFNSVLASVSTMIADSFLLLLMFSALLFASPLIAILTFSIFASAAIVVYRAQKYRAFELGSEIQLLQVELDKNLVLSLEGFQELLVNGNLSKVEDKIHDDLFELSSHNARMSVLPHIGRYVVEVTLLLGTLIAVFAQLAISDAAKSSGVIAVYLVSSSRIAPALLRIQQGLVSIKANQGTAMNFINSPEFQVKTRKESSRKARSCNSKSEFCPEILIDRVNFKRKELGNILVDVSLNIKPGEKVAIVGTSGSGKTTLLQLILGLRTPSSGKVRLSGLPPESAFSIWPGKVAFIPQEIVLAETGYFENIALGLLTEEIDQKFATQLLRRFQLLDRTRRNKFGMQERVKNGRSALSGGEIQRLAFARAMYSKPSILIIDEGTSALDSNLEQKIMNDIMNRKELTVLVVAHRLSAIKKADRVVFMEAGKIVGEGTFKSLSSDNLNFRNLVRNLSVKR